MILDLNRAVIPGARALEAPRPGARARGDRPSYAILRGFLSARCDRLSAEACCIASLYCKARRRPQGRHGWASGVQPYRERGVLPRPLSSGRIKVFGHTQAQGSPFDSGIRPLSFACPPASDSGIRGYTGRARALLPSSRGPGGAPAAGQGPPVEVEAPPCRPSPVSANTICGGLRSSKTSGKSQGVVVSPRPSPASLQSLIPRGVRGASPRLNLTLLQHRFTGVEGKNGRT